MGYRFRKSKSLGGGIKLNVGKKSVGVSIGGKGARMSFSSSGRKTRTIGIPGTGLSYTSSSGSTGSDCSARSSSSTTGHHAAPKRVTIKSATLYKNVFYALAVLLLLTGAASTGMIKIGLILLAFLNWLIGFGFSKEKKRLEHTKQSVAAALETLEKSVTMLDPAAMSQSIAPQEAIITINSLLETADSIEKLSFGLPKYCRNLPHYRATLTEYKKALLQQNQNDSDGVSSGAFPPAPQKQDLAKTRTFKMRVNGVTFDNDDGINRQEIIATITENSPVELEPYEYGGEPAVYVLADGEIIGNIPKEHVDEIVMRIENSEIYDVSIGQIIGGFDHKPYGIILEFEVLNKGH